MFGASGLGGLAETGKRQRKLTPAMQAMEQERLATQRGGRKKKGGSPDADAGNGMPGSSGQFKLKIVESKSGAGTYAAPPPTINLDEFERKKLADLRAQEMLRRGGHGGPIEPAVDAQLQEQAKVARGVLAQQQKEATRPKREAKPTLKALETIETEGALGGLGGGGEYEGLLLDGLEGDPAPAAKAPVPAPGEVGIDPKVYNWLERNGFDVYAVAFMEHQVAWDVLPYMTVDDLRDMGIFPVGPRRRLARALAAFAKARSRPRKH